MAHHSTPTPSRAGRRDSLPAAALAVLILFAGASQAQETATADVVVVVDTSTSMREQGMDPERTSLLVTKLLTDIVPGELAAVRLLDLVADAADLPRQETGEFAPCLEDPTQQCERISSTSDWGTEARTKLLGVLTRSARADASFKKELESHLEQRINNSMFWLSFRAAQGVFERNQAAAKTTAATPRTVIWLSDGRAENSEVTVQILREMVGQGIVVEAIVFGRGEQDLALAAGLAPRRVSTPAEIMKAFAGAFRRVVQAPYEIDNLVSTAPDFEMKANVEEAWVVVYGDQSLGRVELEGPDGKVAADYTADVWPSAGAYKVAYLRQPPRGRFTVRAEGGGPGVAYAVVQRSALTPALLEPQSTLSGAEVALVGGVRAGLDGDLITDPELLAGLTLTASFQGQTATLRDDGTHGDAVAGDGRFSAPAVFRGSGKVPVELRLAGDVVDRTITAEVEVRGEFRYEGGPVEVDLGQLGVAAESCKPLVFLAHHQGDVPFELQRERRLPAGHQLELRLPAGPLAPGAAAMSAGPGTSFQVCLETSESATSSKAAGEHWLTLRVAGIDSPEHRVPIHLLWEVAGLSFWQRWGWLILTILGILLLLFIIVGFVVPQRFSGSLALVFAPERDELDEVTPQPVKQWKGTGIGFYRNARAYLHADYRLSGKASGALAALFAERGGVRVTPGRGAPLLRETLDADWETIPTEGKRARAGDVYRIGDRGPYFRIASHRGR